MSSPTIERVATSPTITLHQVARHAHNDRHGPALRYDGTTVTWGELLENARRLASVLAAAGVQKGDRVALLVSNSPSFVDALLATHLLGAIAVPINVRLSEPEVTFILGDIEPAAVVADQRLLALMTGSMGDVTTIVNDIYGEGSALPSKALRLSEILDNSEPLDLAAAPVVSPDDVAYILYTSGTTGRPKGAMLTHANLSSSCWISTTMNALVGRDDVRYIATPLFHVAALTAVVGGLLMGAVSVMAASGEFDPEKLLDILEGERVTHLFLVPTQWEAVLAAPSLPTRDLPIRAVTWGAAPLSADLLRRMTVAFPGVRVNSTLGQTEMSGVTAFFEGLQPPERAGTVGRPVFLVDVRVVDEAMRDVAIGDVGEIVYRGPTTMAGYWRRADANADAFAGGWFHSGDMVRQDDDGYIYVVDRMKDMIISGGENIYPAELERVIGEHPKVRETAVVGRPHSKWGETPVAFVVPVSEDDPPTHDEIVAWVRAQLASYAKPGSTLVVADLPRNATGKVRKDQLRLRASTTTP
ncbi:AMP-binding protein [Rhodococcus sp. IEGM 1381]|uniref:AMP-binding protein n=1 Tax=Rhodococcus sp. IEGM 1381 TaxID=3047085 RepID=UPI0024B7A399|nr:AMP-binding protein [Rhodococcus sp. IEGM 1381]MDI9894439.1 AMP-binding protein [Rhodococcus sp. IEGM 1381]